MRSAPALWAFIFTVLMTGAAEARVWQIAPDGTGDAPTIQAAIDSAAAGDTLSLANGIFTGEGNWDVEWDGKNIVIRSQGGDPDSCVIDAGTTHFGFDIYGDVTRSAVLEGLTVTHATYAMGHNASYPFWTLWTGSPTVRDCRFVGNESGASCRYMDSPKFVDCEFSTNKSGAAASWSSEFVGCTFSENLLCGLNADEAGTTVTDCVFSKNSGAGVNAYSASVSITRCDFVGNGGGGIYSTVSSVSATDCRFLDNLVRGGVHHTGDYGENLVLTRCLFVGNAAEEGGAVYCNAYDVQGGAHITECTMYGNTAGEGAAIYWNSEEFDADIVIERTIVAANAPGPAIAREGPGSVLVSCSDIFGNDGGDWVGCIAGLDTIPGNISADPRFCDPASGDFHVAGGSPCLESACGRIGAHGHGCLPDIVMDIDTGSCPNRLDVDEGGTYSSNSLDRTLSAAILGSEKLDVLQIDPTSLLLEGVAPSAYGYDDVVSPGVQEEKPNCLDARADGYHDMTLEFPVRDIADAIANASPGDVITLTLTGKFIDGAEFEASDEVTIIDSGSYTYSRGPHVILGPVIPNPANPTARIAYYLPRETRVDLVVYDVAGRVVARLLRDTMPAGEHEVVWDATGVASGVYFAQLVTAREEATYKLVVMK